jgi:hypothetical protein
MNISLLLTGLVLLAIGILFGLVTYGFGFICSWPVILIGFILFIFGFISPSPSSYKQQYTYSTGTFDTGETKRICPQCGKTMPMQSKYCPHCGKPNKYV